MMDGVCTPPGTLTAKDIVTNVATADAPVRARAASLSLLRPDGTHFAGQYRILDRIGDGHQTVVHIARCERTHQTYAAKLVSRDALKRHHHLRTSTSREIEALRRMRDAPHPHLGRLHDVVHTKESLVLIQRLGAGGDLFEHVAANGALPRQHALRVFAQVVRALLHMHTRGASAHRDVKPENIVFLDQLAQDVMLVDLGFATVLDASAPHTQHAACGTPSYMSPEAYQGPLTCELPASDVWSLGVTLYVMVTGFSLFASGNEALDQHEIRHGIFTIPAAVDKDIAELIRAMLRLDWRKRITLDEVLKHRCLATEVALASSGAATPSHAPNVVLGGAEDKESETPVAGAVEQNLIHYHHHHHNDNRARECPDDGQQIPP